MTKITVFICNDRPTREQKSKRKIARQLYPI